MRALIVFLVVLALIGTGLTLYGGNFIDSIWDLFINETTLPMTDLKETSKNGHSYLVVCGGVKAVLSPRQMMKGYSLSELIKGIRIPVKLYLDKKKILIDAMVEGKSQQDVIAAVKRNKLKELPQGFDLNFLENNFEIIDDKKNPVLQVQIERGNEIHVGGCFYQGNKKISVTPERINFYVNECEIDRIFKYPSSKFPGQLEAADTNADDENGLGELGKQELVTRTSELLKQSSALTCLNAGGSLGHKGAEDPLAIENDRVDTYKKKHRKDALKIRAELMDRLKIPDGNRQFLNEFIFREPTGFFGLAEIDFALRYLKRKYVSTYSGLDDSDLKKSAVDYVNNLELLLKHDSPNDIDLCRYDRELKVEGFVLLEAINGRLPDEQKFNKNIEFMMLTKWTVNYFQILEMKKTVKLYAERL